LACAVITIGDEYVYLIPDTHTLKLAPVGDIVKTLVVLLYVITLSVVFSNPVGANMIAFCVSIDEST
jgi:hypothetical protein